MSEPLSPLETQDLRRHVAQLAGHHQLSARAADALVTLAQRVVDPQEDPVGRKSNTSIRNRLASSLVALELEQVRMARRMADVGSGSGFPGLVLAAALPQASVTLVEKKPTRCAFLRGAAAAMGLSNVEVVQSAVQKWSEGVASCDLVTSRAVARPDAMIELVAPLLALGGAAVLWGSGSRNLAKEGEAAVVAEEIGLQPAAVRLMEPLGTALVGSRDRAATRLEILRGRIETREAGGVESIQAEELEDLRREARQVERKIQVLRHRRSRAESKLARQAAADAGRD